MHWELGFLRVFLYTIVSSYFIVKSLQLRGRRQIAEPRKYCLVRVIVFFGVCFLYLFCFSQVGILVKFPNKWYQSPWWCAMKVVMCSWSLPNGDRESLNGPHTKILEKKERKEKLNKGILLMVLNNGVVRGSHGHRRARSPWMCVRG